MTSWFDIAAAVLWQSSLESGIFAAAIWAVTKLFPRIPALVQVWMWRAAMLRFLIGPLLTLQFGHMPTPSPNWIAPVLVSLLAAMFASSWIKTAVEALALKHTLRDSELCFDKSILAAVAQMSERLALAQVPVVKVSAQISSPMLTGFQEPELYLPAQMPEGEKTAQAAIAHELAHINHADLRWNWLGTITESLMLFHPLFWVARRELMLAQELACDAAAIEASRTERPEYCRILLSFSLPRKAVNPALSVGLASCFKSLRRRITMIGAGANPSRVHPSVAALILCVGLIPNVHPKPAAHAKNEVPAVAAVRIVASPAHERFPSAAAELMGENKH